MRRVEERFGDRNPIVVRAWERADGVRIEVEPRSGAAGPVLDLSVAPGGAPRGPGAGAAWSMVRGLPLRGNAWDPFVALLRDAHDLLYPRDPREGPRPRPTAEEREAARRSMRRLYAMVRALAVHAADRCDPAHRRMALRFSPCLRLRLYRLFLEDPTGRLAQLATSCPGALVFAAAMNEPGWGQSVGVRLLADAVAGSTLPRLLARAAEGWFEEAQGVGADRPADPMWDRVLFAGDAERCALVAAQRVLVRRAGPRVPPTLLLLPPPLAFAPEDIPGRVRDNARWYRVMKSSRRTLLREGGDATAGQGLARFASRHALALFAAARRARVAPREIVSELADYVTATGRRPSRATDPARLLLECAGWHARAHRDAELSTVGGPGVTAETPLPPAPGGTWRHATVAVRPLSSAGELVDEGRRMRHCVASHLAAVLAGGTFIYAIEIAGERLTAELRRSGHGGLALTEMKGVANREPWREELEALRPWLEAVGAVARLGAGGAGDDIPF